MKEIYFSYLKKIIKYEKDQVMKTNVWINLKWRDFQFEWSSKDYKVGSVRVPPDRVWVKLDFNL